MGRVVVIGSANMDVVATVVRIPRPGETVSGRGSSITPGGKGANQAVAARRLGAVTTIVGAIGSDAFGSGLREFLADEGLDTSLLVEVGRPTGAALIVVDDRGENSIVVVPGANDLVTPEAVDRVGLGDRDVVLLQNEIPPAVNEAAVAAAKRAGATAVLNLAPYRETEPAILRDLDYLVVNETEFALLVGAGPEPMPAGRVGELLAAGAGATANVIVTCAAEGLWARIDGRVVRVGGHRVDAVDSTGAGDCFCGGFGAGLARGSSPTEALDFANAAAAISVQRPGAAPAMPRAAAVEALVDRTRGAR